MTKMSEKGKPAKKPKQKRQLRGSNARYLKPGVLAAQVRYSRASSSSSKPCVGILPLGLGSCRKEERVVEILGVDKSPVMMSPVNLIKQGTSLIGTPKTPRADLCESESRLESLPMDLLVMILCHLHHDQLKPVFHVSQRVRKAVLLARQYHFNYTTPDRSRQELLNKTTPQPTHHYPFLRGSGDRFCLPTPPPTPKAPRHGPRPSSRLRLIDVRQVAAVLFPESVLPPRCMVPSVLSAPICKPVASNRVLFCEDDLCQAVAQNKLL